MELLQFCTKPSKYPSCVFYLFTEPTFPVEMCYLPANDLLTYGYMIG